MRRILLLWMMDTCHKLRLLEPTYFLSCILLDHYLKKLTVLKHNLQLIGIGCILIANKYYAIGEILIDDSWFTSKT